MKWDLVCNTRTQGVVEQLYFQNTGLQLRESWSEETGYKKWSKHTEKEREKEILS